MKKQVAKFLRRLANRFDPPIPQFGAGLPYTQTSANPNVSLTFKRDA